MAPEDSLTYPRPFRDEADLERMLSILMEGCQAANGGFYIHPGDLKWWLYYLPIDSNPWQHLYLWEDKSTPNKVIGWTLLSPTWQAFDVFLAPAWYGSRLAEQIYAWSEERLAEIIRSTGGQEIRTVWVAEQDRRLTSMLISHGFKASDAATIHFQQSLGGSIPASVLPANYWVRTITGEQDLERRAMAQYAAFESTLPFDRYCQRYLRFMHSPVYRPEHDLVIEAPTGEIAAFCLLWLDETNRVGLLEPVGVHPAFQRKGLGKALLHEALHRLQSAGMRQAIVNTEGENRPAQQLYLSTGFQVATRLITFTKTLPEEVD